MHLQWLILLHKLAMCCLCLLLAPAAIADAPRPAATQVLTRATVVEEHPLGGVPVQVQRAVQMPDEWDRTRPGFEGRMRYRLQFSLPGLPAEQAGSLQALYIERACTTADVRLNGVLIASGGPMAPPYALNCYRPQLVMLPAALLQADRPNTLEIQLAGHPLQRVAARQRAAGLSALQIGPHAELRAVYERQLFWKVTLAEMASVSTALLALFMLALASARHREPAYLYFGLTLLGWSAISAQLWLRELPFPMEPAHLEVLISALFPPVVLCAVLFLMRYGGVRQGWLDALLALQCVVVPLSFSIAGSPHVFTLARIWYAVYALEVLAAALLYLRLAWREQRSDFPMMALVLSLVTLFTIGEVAVQLGWVDMQGSHPIHFGMPVLFIVVGLRLLQLFLRALQSAEQARLELEQRVLDKTAEIERNYAELANARIEQVAEAERKRIAADLHDDLGAKLLTIVHTSDNERIATLAREALEEMRLSVRGLTGKPVKLADALADWRAENVSRLGQANVQLEWVSYNDNDERSLSARAYVQTTRILREAVNNIIKHSGADAVSIRCEADETDFSLMIRDNGRGIPLEVDGRLDRGHGMASMKRRAKQLAGQCLVESSAGSGTVLRLTLPL